MCSNWLHVPQLSEICTHYLLDMPLVFMNKLYMYIYYLKYLHKTLRFECVNIF